MVLAVLSLGIALAEKAGRRQVLVLTENAGQHKPFSDAAIGWMKEFVKGHEMEMTVVHDTEKIDSVFFPRFRMLVYANEQVEEAHRQFAHDAIRFFRDMTIGDGLVVDVTTDAADINDEKLRTYHLFVCLNDNPGHTQEQREAFRRYMERGGAWLGFHAAGYNDRSTNWPWYLDFLGGGVFHRNNWPPQSAKLVVDDKQHPVTKAMPDTYMAPMNEWYQWKPSPRENEKVKVLVTLSPENYPLGFKDTVPDGDLPVVWTNTDFNMLYINMGHGPRTFVDPTQNYLIYNAIRWLMRDKFE